MSQWKDCCLLPLSEVPLCPRASERQCPPYQVGVMPSDSPSAEGVQLATSNLPVAPLHPCPHLIALNKLPDHKVTWRGQGQCSSL